MRHSSRRELPRSGIASETKWVRDRMSQKESHGRLCDIISIHRGRNSKSIRRGKKRKKNHNTAQLPLPQIATPSNACCLWHSWQTIFQGGLISQNARNLNTQEARMVRVIILDAEAMAAAANVAGTREDPIDVDTSMHNNPMPHPPTPGPTHGPNLPCFQCWSRNHISKNCPDHCCPYCNRTAPGHNQSVCSEQECRLYWKKGHIVANCPFDNNWDDNDIIENKGHTRDWVGDSGQQRG